MRFTSAFCSETLSYYYTVACEYSTYWWTTLSLSTRRLNDNEISILEATGAFKKLPNLRKMYERVYFSFSVWLLNDICVFGKFSFALDSGTSKASGIFQPNGKTHAVIYCQAIFAALSKSEESGFRSGRGLVIYHAWNCLLSSTVINRADLKARPYILLKHGLKLIGESS